MNILVKSAVAGVLALGATSAFSLGLPSANSSDLILVVKNLTNQATYALDTGITINTEFNTTGIVKSGNTAAAYSLSTSLSSVNTTIAASSTLLAFLAANPASGDSWTVEAGQYNGGGVNNSTNSNSNAVGAAKMVFSSALLTITPSNATNFTLPNIETFGTKISNDINPVAQGPLAPLLTTTEVTGTDLYSDTDAATSKYGLLGANDMEVTGATDKLFAFTGNGTTGALNSFILGTAVFNADGSLVLAGNATTGGGGGTAPVPLPAAVWLFGSGLLGLVGISRRRKPLAV
jgi:hypothetical protein